MLRDACFVIMQGVYAPILPLEDLKGRPQGAIRPHRGGGDVDEDWPLSLVYLRRFCF